MRRLVERGLAIVFITHKLEEARRFGDRITCCKLGRKVGEVAPDHLRRLWARRPPCARSSTLMFGKLTDERGRPSAHSRNVQPSRAKRRCCNSATSR